MRTDPFLPSVCQSPSGVGASSSWEIFTAGGAAAGAPTGGGSSGGGSIGTVGGAGITMMVPVAGGVVDAGVIGAGLGGSIGARGGAGITMIVPVVAGAVGLIGAGGAASLVVDAASVTVTGGAEATG